VGVVHITLTAATLSSNREVPYGVPAPQADAVLSPQIVTFGLFLTVHPHTTAPIHTPNRTILNPAITLLEKRPGLFLSALSKVQFCPRNQPHPRSHLKLLRQCFLVLPKYLHGRSQKFSHRLPQ